MSRNPKSAAKAINQNCHLNRQLSIVHCSHVDRVSNVTLSWFTTRLKPRTICTATSGLICTKITGNRLQSNLLPFCTTECNIKGHTISTLWLGMDTITSNTKNWHLQSSKSGKFCDFGMQWEHNYYEWNWLCFLSDKRILWEQEQLFQPIIRSLNNCM